MAKNEVLRKYMMATKAIHKLGDISRDQADLCIVYAEEGEEWIGNWVTGFGFFDVRFPKATTRDLTAAEVEHWHGRRIQIGNGPSIPIRIKPEEPSAGEKSEIVLPDDAKLETRLVKKLAEYRGRYRPYSPPEMQMDTICKVAVLERLLQVGKVDTHQLWDELVAQYGAVSAHDFNNACGVIDDYCQTGGKNVSGGNGLPVAV